MPRQVIKVYPAVCRSQPAEKMPPDKPRRHSIVRFTNGNIIILQNVIPPMLVKVHLPHQGSQQSKPICRGSATRRRSCLLTFNTRKPRSVGLMLISPDLDCCEAI